jgi:transcriptional regulator with XRE-family HTH domain
MDVAEKIYKQMLVKGLNQKALARSAGISDSEVSRILRRKSSPSLEYASRLAQALEVSLDYLADDTATSDSRQERAETLDGEMTELTRAIGPKHARRLLEIAHELGYELAIRRLLGVEAKPVIGVVGRDEPPLPERVPPKSVAGSRNGSA